MSDETLEPKLTKHDRRVLASVPSMWAPDGRRAPNDSRSIWSIAEELGILDITGDLLLTLNGFEWLGYVESWASHRGSVEVRSAFWARTRKGDEEVAR